MGSSARVLDCFAGLGGLALAWHRAGGQATGFVEGAPPPATPIGSTPYKAGREGYLLGEYNRRVLRRHWPGVPSWGDLLASHEAVVAELRGQVDVLSGGPPCQPASYAGVRRGTDDPRWLWPAFLALAEDLRPPIVLAENPPSVLTVQGGRAFGAILEALGQLGYLVAWDVLAAGLLGAPHRRERVWIVARRDGIEPLPRRPALRGSWGVLADGRRRWPRAGRWTLLEGVVAVAPRWPTPRTLPWEAATGRKALPTPVARDARSGGLVTRRGGTTLPDAVGAVGGRLLAPELVEWMMGLPVGWSREEGVPLLDSPLAPWQPDRSAELAITTDKLRRRVRVMGLGNSVVVPCAELIARLVLAMGEPAWSQTRSASLLCLACGEPFVPPPIGRRSIYCSHACRQAAWAAAQSGGNVSQVLRAQRKAKSET